MPPAGDRRRNPSRPRIDVRTPFLQSLWWILIIAALAFVSVAAVALLIQTTVYHVQAFGSALVSASVAALFVFHVTNGIRMRRKATARRLRAISDLNHHIRNGLQQIAAVANLYASGGYEEIQSAIDRIERILRDSTTEIRHKD